MTESPCEYPTRGIMFIGILPKGHDRNGLDYHWRGRVPSGDTIGGDCTSVVRAVSKRAANEARAIIMASVTTGNWKIEDNVVPHQLVII